MRYAILGIIIGVASAIGVIFVLSEPNKPATETVPPIHDTVLVQPTPDQMVWPTSYYLAMDYGVSSGTVLEVLPEEVEDGDKMYIKISTPSGRIVVEEINEKTWYALRKGDVLK